MKTSAYILHLEDTGLTPEETVEALTGILLQQGVPLIKINPWSPPGQTTSDPINALNAKLGTKT